MNLSKSGFYFFLRDFFFLAAFKACLPFFSFESPDLLVEPGDFAEPPKAFAQPSEYFFDAPLRNIVMLRFLQDFN